MNQRVQQNQILISQLFWTKKNPRQRHTWIMSCFPVILSLHWDVSLVFFQSKSFVFKAKFFRLPDLLPSNVSFFVKAGIGWVAFFTRALGDLGTRKSIQVCPKWTFNLNNFSCVREPTPGTETSFGSPTEQNFAKHVLKEKRYVSSNLERNMVFFENTELVRNMIYITFLQHQICLQIQECRMVFVSVFLLNIIDL